MISCKRQYQLVGISKAFCLLGFWGLVAMSCMPEDLSLPVHDDYRKTYVVDGVPFTMIMVEGGTFMMGTTNERGSNMDSDEEPVHQVTLDNYWIGDSEVTQELWQAVMGSNPSYNITENTPVERVTWDDCQVFITKLNSLTGENFRLPTEAEWEFAARGGNASKGYRFSGSNNLDSVAWYMDNSLGTTHPIKTKGANELGIYDMSGNVYEWCADKYGRYSSSPQTNTTGANYGSYRVLRGGCWAFEAGCCHVAERYYNSPTGANHYYGLRLAQ